MTTPSPRLAWFLIFSVVFLSCGDSNLPKYYQLGGLRILDILVDQPEVAAGTNGVLVTPIVTDISGGGRALTYAAEACLDPGIGFGAKPSCANAADRVDLGTGAVTGLAAPNYTGAAANISVNIPAAALTGRSAADQHNGVAYVVVYTVSAADGATQTAFSRIIVSSKAVKNTNPAFSAILGNDAVLAALPASAVHLKTDATTASAETYELLTRDGTTVGKTEVLQVTWFISDGALEFTRTTLTGTATWTPPGSAPAGHNTVVIAILRDTRGGSAWKMLAL